MATRHTMEINWASRQAIVGRKQLPGEWRTATTGGIRCLWRSLEHLHRRLVQVWRSVTRSSGTPQQIEARSYLCGAIPEPQAVEGFYQMLFWHSPEAMLIVNVQGQMQASNLAAQHLFGYTEPQLHGQSIQQILPGLAPSFWAEWSATLTHTQQTISTTEISAQIHGVRHDGSLFPVLLSLAAQGDREHPYWLCIVRDITAWWEQQREQQQQQAELANRLAHHTHKLASLNQVLQKEVGEKTEAEIALRESELRYRTIVESQTELVCRYDPSGILTFVNEACCHYFEQSATQLIGQAFLAMLCHHSVVEDVQYFSALTPETLTESFEYEIKQQGGQTRWLQWINRPIFNAHNEIIEYQAVGRDISRQKEIEQALLASGARYQQMIEQASDGVWLIDQDYQTLFVNQKMAKMLGYNAAEIIGHSIFEFMDEEGQAIAARKFKDRRSDVSEQYDLKLCCQDGSTLWVIISMTPNFDASDHYVGSLSIMTDITERKKAEAILQESEERFRAIFEQAGVGMVILTPDGRFFRVNQKICDILQYSRLDLLQLAWHELVARDTIAKTQAAHQRLIQGFDTHYTHQQKYRRADGQWVWLNVTMSLITESNGQPKYFIGVIEDISHERAALKERQAAEECLLSLLNTMPELACLIEPEGHILQSNQAFAQFLQTPIVRLITENLYEVLPSAIAASYRPAVEQVCRTKQPTYFSSIERDRYFEHTICPIADGKGNVTRLAVFALDLSERQQTEEQLREQQQFVEKIADSSPNILYVYDLETQHLAYCNNQVTAVLGYSLSECEQFSFKHFMRLVHPDEKALVVQHLRACCSLADHDVLEIKYRCQHKQGNWRWLVSRDTVFKRDRAGKILQILGTASDITAQKAAEDRIQLTNAQLVEKVVELEQRHQEMMLLGRMNGFLQLCTSLQEAERAIADLLKPLFPDCAGQVFRLNQTDHALYEVAQWGTGAAAHASVPHFPLSHCWALRRGQRYQGSRSDSGLLCRHYHDAPLLAESLCLPLMAQGEVIGLLTLVSEQPGVISEPKQQLAHTVAEHLGLAIANLELQETLKYQSIRDPLTGLYNRRYMNEVLQQILARAAREVHTVGLVMVDVDHFKHFNDSFGHDAGDQVLRNLGEFIRQQLRESDVPCRYGGEEIILILPQATLENTYKRAEALRLGVQHLQTTLNHQRLEPITISLGVACYPAHGDTSDTLLKAADTALYAAKHRGRNCTAIAAEPPAE